MYTYINYTDCFGNALSKAIDKLHITGNYIDLSNTNIKDYIIWHISENDIKPKFGNSILLTKTCKYYNNYKNINKIPDTTFILPEYIDVQLPKLDILYDAVFKKLSSKTLLKIEVSSVDTSDIKAFLFSYLPNVITETNYSNNLIIDRNIQLQKLPLPEYAKQELNYILIKIGK